MCNKKARLLTGLTLEKRARGGGGGHVDSNILPQNSGPRQTPIDALLQQADRRHQAANERGVIVAAVSHLLIWFELYELKQRLAGRGGER